MARAMRENCPTIGPDLVVEVLSKSHTKAEIARQLVESFAAGTRLSWIVDPKPETVRVHLVPLDSTLLQAGDLLDGGVVIPELRIAVEALFEWKDN